MPAKPSARSVTLVALLVLGLGCSFAFQASLADLDVTYAAIPVQPGDTHGIVADADPNVSDLSARLDGTPDAARGPVDRAARTGSFAGNLSPDLHVAIGDLDAPYVVYDGSYYRFHLDVDDETTYATIRMTPVDATTVLRNVSSPLDAAPPAVRSAVEFGRVTADSVRPGVYRGGDAYYAVAVENEARVAVNLFGRFLGYLLAHVGRGYVAVALGLLALRYRDPLTDRPLTPRRAVGVAALAVPVGVVAATLFESGSPTRFLTAPAGSLVVATGVVAGVLVHQRRWLSLAGLTLLVAVLAVGVPSFVLGRFGAFLGVVGLFVGLLGGVVPLGFGAAFGADRPGATTDDAGAAD